MALRATSYLAIPAVLPQNVGLLGGVLAFMFTTDHVPLKVSRRQRLRWRVLL
jgi:hypothetical protein